MSLLLTPHALAERRAAASGPLAPLAASLRADLAPLFARAPEVPVEKALLSRDGGRCAEHGVALEFDPYTPHEHRCPLCGAVHTGERHDRWWVWWYQLWLAERAVHAAALAVLGHDDAAARLAGDILRQCAERYLGYPNRDNALGPTRPFFSTYLESIWMLQLAIALDLLEVDGRAGGLSGLVRDRLLEPSAALIASFDEHGSNRQVWNDAAMLAAGRLLGRDDLVDRALAGASGLRAQLAGGLLADGTWYEGENYHLFAHRGLWYGVTMAEAMGAVLPPELVARFEEGFATPFASALPDYTFPSRRDSQYAVSLRQWRTAESCELGLARRDDPRLRGALWELYERPGIPRRDPGRWRSTAESERNEPASALTRADLGWRSLLLARPGLPPLQPVPARSALLEGQGLAVLRRDGGRAWLALDYGHAGGGHGHPDRLDVLLSVGDDRWLDDMGTGSYVDPSLHWYRSTLAHNAPLVNGQSQQRTAGVLRAWDERGGVGWADAELRLGAAASGVRVRRSLVMMPDYAVDRLEWQAAADVDFALPIHLDARVDGAGPFQGAVLLGGSAPEDGFAFVRDAEVAPAAARTVLRLERGGRIVGWVLVEPAGEIWRAIAPGPPGRAPRPFLLLRWRSGEGVAHVVWDWGAVVANVDAAGDGAAVTLRDGARHTHRAGDNGWHVDLAVAGAHSSVDLGGSRERPAIASTERERPEPELVPAAPAAPLARELGESAYRTSEVSWQDAGEPRATVSLVVSGGSFVIDVHVRKAPLVFRAADAPDPALDNEPPDVHSDGVQLYVRAPEWHEHAGWLLVPEPEHGRVRTSHVAGTRADIPLDAAVALTPDGYRMRLAVPLALLGDCRENPVALQVVVNDMAPGRVRRRGQLVLSGAHGAPAYLRGDRESPDGFLDFLLPRV